jgi:hypothetical protein
MLNDALRHVIVSMYEEDLQIGQFMWTQIGTRTAGNTAAPPPPPGRTRGKAMVMNSHKNESHFPSFLGHVPHLCNRGYKFSSYIGTLRVSAEQCNSAIVQQVTDTKAIIET